MPTLTAPGPLPPIVHNPADAQHFTPGRTRALRYIVLHSTQGWNSLAWLTYASPAGRRASAHILADRDGTRRNLVNYGDTAFHVGVARGGVYNSNSIGIELENPNTANQLIVPYPDAQFNTAAHWIATILYSWGLTWAGAVRLHRDIAIPAGRRTDPDGLNIPRLQRETLAWLAFFRADPANEAWIV